MVRLEFVTLGLAFKWTCENSLKILISYEREGMVLSLKWCSMEAADQAIGKRDCGLTLCFFHSEVDDVFWFFFSVSLPLPQCLIFLDDPQAVSDILEKLVKEDNLLMAYQICFDLYESASQQFLSSVIQNLRTVGTPIASVPGSTNTGTVPGSEKDRWGNWLEKRQNCSVTVLLWWSLLFCVWLSISSSWVIPFKLGT